MAVWNVIDHQELGASGATSWDKDSISGSYDHLYLLAHIRTDDASTYNDKFKVVLNDDTATNYSYTDLYTGTSTPSSGMGATKNEIENLYCSSSSTLADTFGVFQMWILDYTSTSKYKQTLSFYGCPNNSTTDWQWTIGQVGAMWRSTAAVTKIEVTPFGAPTDKFVQYSTFTLYGINGAA